MLHAPAPAAAAHFDVAAMSHAVDASSPLDRLGLSDPTESWRLVGDSTVGPVFLDHRTDSVLSSVSVGTLTDLLLTSVGA